VGAAVAQRAAASAPNGIAKLVLMDPIADGRNYLDTLRTRNFRYEGLGYLPASLEFRSNPDVYIEESSGFAISRELCDQLRGMRFVATSPSVETVVICDSRLPEGREIVAACANATGLRVVDHPFGEDWMSRVVPPPTIKLLVDELGSCA
jgi:pimeloyl-ACP methyl ester carboxylesterase